MFESLKEEFFLYSEFLRRILYGLLFAFGVGIIGIIMVGMSLATHVIPVKPVFVMVFMITAFAIGMVIGKEIFEG